MRDCKWKENNFGTEWFSGSRIGMALERIKLELVFINR